jgi:hypothetical protein
VYNSRTELYVLTINAHLTGGALYSNYAATSVGAEGPFENLKLMGKLAHANTNLGDFGIYVEADSAYLAYNVMGSGQGIVVEKLDPTFTDGTGTTSNCLNCPFYHNTTDSDIM